MYQISVTKFNSIVRDIFNNEELLHSVNIVGEVFGISKAKNAVYFSIKDENSSLPCICFDSVMSERLNEGDMVTLSGGPAFYAKTGRFNYIANKIEPYGQGLLYQRFIELKNKLEQEGLFDASNKKAMPKNIRRIGVVTSKDGAVLQDIKNVSWRRNKSVDIVLYPTKVQGIDAEKEIAEGINFFSEYENVDVVVVARGGGSLEDLSAFNTELVARATFNCKKPIVSAVGHETDFTIIDFVSDLRAPTPSAAAELLTTDIDKEKDNFTLLIKRLSRQLVSTISDSFTQLQDLCSNFVGLYEDKLNKQKRILNGFCSKISSILTKNVTDKQHNLQLLLTTLEKLNPTTVLKRGYAKVEQNERQIKSAEEVSISVPLTVNFYDGYVIANPIEKKG